MHMQVHAGTFPITISTVVRVEQISWNYGTIIVIIDERLTMRSLIFNHCIADILIRVAITRCT